MICLLCLLAFLALPVVFVLSSVWLGYFGRMLPGEPFVQISSAATYTTMALIYSVVLCLYFAVT